MKLQLLALAALAALTACGTAPNRHAALDQARERHRTLAADDELVRLAGPELRQADGALRRAEAALASDAEADEVDHLAYLATQHLVIAQTTAEARQAQAVTAGAAAERERLRLALRTAEADAAQRSLGVARADGERQNAELAAAERSATADQARLAQRDARVEGLEQELRALNARPSERGMVVTLGDVLFDTGRSQLRAGGARGLQQLAAFMARHPDMRASIEGHTDDVGGDAGNQALSEQRARSVMARLVSLGVAPARLQAQGFGETRPAGANDSAAGRQMNRRVEMIFMPLERPAASR